ncbi:MAG: response regulator [Desulfobacula sp.]|jgi:PAS domain S-box-containing protein
MGPIRFKSIRKRFTIWFVFVIVMIVLASAFYMIRYNYQAAREEVSLDLANISNIAKIGLSTALWHYNQEYISDYMDSLFSYDDIVYVGIWSHDMLIQTKTRPGHEENDIIDLTSSNYISRETRIDHNDIQIGKIMIVMSYDRVTGVILHNILIRFFVLCIILFAILITNYLLLESYIFKPVKKLEDSARRIASGALDTIIETEARDEIGNLAETFNLMMFNIKSITTSRDNLNHEVKERRKTQIALEESNERFLQLANTTSDMFWLFDVADPDHIRVLYLNPSFEAIWHRKIEEAYQRPETLVENLHPEDKKNLLKEFFNFLKKGDAFLTEFRIMLPDRSIRHIWAKGNLIFDKTGKLIRVAGIARDITEQFQAQKENEKLTHQLQHVHKMEAIGTLAGGIAHDFNNILGIIIGNAELAIDDVSGQHPARVSLEEIIIAGKRAKDVVWQLLSFARKSEREKEPVDLSLILKESMSLLRSSIPKTIDISLDFQNKPCRIMADATQIHQVILNLCTNAAHAMADNGGKLEVTLEKITIGVNAAADYPQLPAGDYARLAFTDTGHGIDPNIRNRVFDPYFTTKPIGKGTGMGLAVVHGIVKNHGGEILFNSILHKGTTFELFFPALLDEIVVKAKDVKQISKGSERILFVDDENSLVDIGKRILTRLGYSVEVFTSPVDALDRFRKDPCSFDLMMTDMTMPEMTGDKLIKEVLAIRPDMPVILCTGYSETVNEQNAIELGAKKYIEKPLNIQEISIAIREIFDLNV